MQFFSLFSVIYVAKHIFPPFSGSKENGYSAVQVGWGEWERGEGEQEQVDGEQEQVDGKGEKAMPGYYKTYTKEDLSTVYLPYINRVSTVYLPCFNRGGMRIDRWLTAN